MARQDKDRNSNVKKNITYYRERAAEYDIGMDWLFKSFEENEGSVRKRMVDLLELKPDYRVLEIGAGTCRDSIEIAKRLSADGEIYINDLSAQMLAIGKDRLKTANLACSMNFFVGDVVKLPFPDEFFDAVYHFGGFNLFADRKKTFKEITRVVRKGKKVVVGDEGLAPWLQNTTYGAILLNANPLYKHEVPLEDIPPNAKDVCVEWILGNAFYLIHYRAGDSTPHLNLDLTIPGRRGGTLRTRYYGNIEGITPETRQKMEEAAMKQGISLHEWLEKVIKAQLER